MPLKPGQKVGNKGLQDTGHQAMRKVIPERWKLDQVNSTTVTAYWLERASRLQLGQWKLRSSPMVFLTWEAEAGIPGRPKKLQLAGRAPRESCIGRELQRSVKLALDKMLLWCHLTKLEIKSWINIKLFQSSLTTSKNKAQGYL